MLYDTDPLQKMPDEEKIQTYDYNVKLRIDFDPARETGYYFFTGNLTGYYSWCLENSIFMEHSVLIQGQDGKRTLVMFVFENATDAMAFKLAWK